MNHITYKSDFLICRTNLFNLFGFISSSILNLLGKAECSISLKYIILIFMICILYRSGFLYFFRNVSLNNYDKHVYHVYQVHLIFLHILIIIVILGAHGPTMHLLVEIILFTIYIINVISY